MAAKTREELCTQALSSIGVSEKGLDLDSPKTVSERECLSWYDDIRQNTLISSRPSFAQDRRNIAQPFDPVPSPGFIYKFPVPADALVVMGIGEEWNKTNNYTIEGNFILTNSVLTRQIDASNGNNEKQAYILCRFLRDEKDVSKMSPSFKRAFVLNLAATLSRILRQDHNQFRSISEAARIETANCAAIEGQQNMPIRIEKSRFRRSKRAGIPTLARKR